MLFLSKSRYCSAVQCPKMLWLRMKRPELFDDSVMNQAVLDMGNEVGDLAMGLFGPFREVPFGDLSGMIAETKMLLDQGTPVIAEASFSFRGAFCSVDILKDLGRNAVEIYEVNIFADDGEGFAIAARAEHPVAAFVIVRDTALFLQRFGHGAEDPEDVPAFATAVIRNGRFSHRLHPPVRSRVLVRK